MTSAELEAIIAQIDSAPGFLDGTLRDRERAAHDDLLAKRKAAYERLYPGRTRQDMDLEATGDGPDLRQAGIVEEARGEMSKLADLGFQTHEPDPEIRPFEVAALKMQRLAAEENYAELGPLLLSEMEGMGATTPEIRRQVRDFMNADGLDSLAKENIAREVIGSYLRTAKARQAALDVKLPERPDYSRMRERAKHYNPKFGR